MSKTAFSSLEGLSAFSRLRDGGADLFIRYIERLAAETGLNPVVDSSPTESATAAPTARTSFLRLVPKYFRQAGRLKAARRANPCELVLALSSGRLLRGVTPGELRPYLADVCREFPGRLAEGLSPVRTLQSAERILVCEPIAQSPFWETEAECARSGIFIVDVSFLLFQAVCHPWKTLRNTVSLLTAGLRVPSQRSFAARCRDLVSTALLQTGLEVSFHGGKIDEAFFFTSNSFATEVARWFLLGRSGGPRVTEFLHGIPTTDVLEYFESLVRVGKQYFVPQIPLNLGPRLEQWNLGKQAGINPYLRSHFTRGTLEAGLQALGSGSAPFVFTVVGAPPHGGDVTTARVQALECALLERAHRVLSQAGAEWDLVYAPHPAVSTLPPVQESFFREKGVRIERQTMLALFVSDAVAALVSSAVLEAAYLGAEAFFPIRERDGLYPASILEKVAHPQDAAPWTEAFNRFLEKAVGGLRQEPRPRFQERAQSFLGAPA
ncbi:hypothetical protein K2X33_10325 [bacterium]|nr:hypothetical protein [bacterium]